MALTLRRALTTDLAALATLMNTAYRGTGPNASWNTEARYLDGDRTSEAALKEDLAAKPESFLLIAEEDSQPPLRGCVWLEPQSDETWYLGSLTVDPTLQKSGLGRTLLASAEQWAKERGARTIEMHVINVRDTLIAWYERRGYRLTGETHPFPYGDNRFGTPLRNDLAFVVLDKQL
ncbi:GNAT family N-acetyltransferase [Granulicella aggregans]|uniref:GNAT family N-acetyltransferase n=1 Tax=Granulicella aggregans TaxID=474949 RepID=UPI0021DFF895|nr:GNAT family N-acetyltransferase [Granulicella aggregans]